jgi:hypothetical protein
MTNSRQKLVALALAFSPVLVIGVLTVDARTRRRARGAEQPAIDELARRLPTSDLALSGGARWLRAPSLEEPSAAFADGPAAPDPDPAGGAMAPPTSLWRATEERSRKGAP